jgi:dihydroxyacetone kinase-like predicted kinase
MTSAGLCHVGDVLGIVEGDVVEIGDAVEDVAVRILTRILHAGGGELVTLVCGDECADTAAATISRRLRREHAGVEVVVFDGGQPLWPLIVGVE